MNKKNEQLPNYEKHQESGSEELDQKVLGIYIEKMLVDSAKINEGNNGVIEIFKKENLSDEVKAYFLKKFPTLFDEEDGAVVKMLKIYQNGRGKQEFKMQERAFNILNGKNGVADIPRPYLYEELDITDESVKDKLLRDGVDVGSKNKVEIIVMDYIKGDDLATHIFKLVLKNAQENSKIKSNGNMIYQNENIDELSFNDLQVGVAHLCDFRKVEVNGTGGERDFVRRKIDSDNANKILKYMKDNGLTLPEEWFRIIRETNNVMHAENLYHRDLHERNIMIKDGQLYYIDFGSSAIMADGADQEDVYMDKMAGKKLVEDEYVVNMWSTVAGKKELYNKEQELINDLREAYEAICTSRLWLELGNNLGRINKDEITNFVDRMAKNLVDTETIRSPKFDKVRILLYKYLLDNSDFGDRVKNSLILLGDGWSDQGKKLIVKLLEIKK